VADGTQIEVAATRWLQGYRSKLTKPEVQALYDKITSGAADGMLYVDTNKIYATQNANWRYDPAVSNIHPNVLGFMDWFRTAHPDVQIDRTSTLSQVRFPY
jgi:hypothetical protein